MVEDLQQRGLAEAVGVAVEPVHGPPAEERVRDDGGHRAGAGEAVGVVERAGACLPTDEHGRTAEEPRRLL